MHILVLTQGFYWLDHWQQTENRKETNKVLCRERWRHILEGARASRSNVFGEAGRWSDGLCEAGMWTQDSCRGWLIKIAYWLVRTGVRRTSFLMSAGGRVTISSLGSRGRTTSVFAKAWGGVWQDHDIIHKVSRKQDDIVIYEVYNLIYKVSRWAKIPSTKSAFIFTGVRRQNSNVLTRVRSQSNGVFTGISRQTDGILTGLRRWSDYLFAKVSRDLDAGFGSHMLYW